MNLAHSVQQLSNMFLVDMCYRQAMGHLSRPTATTVTALLVRPSAPLKSVSALDTQMTVIDTLLVSVSIEFGHF